MTVELHRAIEKHLRATGMAPSRFGRDAVNDPRLVFDLRNGRSLRPKVANRVAAYLANPASIAYADKRRVWTPEREAQLCQLVASGASAKAIAASMGMTLSAVNTAVHRIVNERFPDRETRVPARVLFRQATNCEQAGIVARAGNLDPTELGRLIAAGRSRKAIAQHMGVSDITVRKAIFNLANRRFPDRRKGTPMRLLFKLAA